MKKTVGVILREWEANYKNLPLYGVGRSMIKFLRKYDINLICIPIVFEDDNEISKVKEIIDLCDGIR